MVSSVQQRQHVALDFDIPVDVSLAQRKFVLWQFQEVLAQELYLEPRRSLAQLDSRTRRSLNFARNIEMSHEPFDPPRHFRQGQLSRRFRGY